MNDDTVIPWTQRNLTRAQLCAIEGISRDTLNKMERAGYGPAWTVFPGTTVERITPLARAEWHAQMGEWQAANAASLEAVRKARLENMAALGKLSIRSPRHPSRKAAVR